MPKDGRFKKGKKVKHVETGQGEKLKIQKYKLSSPYRKVAFQLNKAYDEVKQSGLTNNTIKLYEQTLEKFYSKYDRKVKNPHHISQQIQMSEEQIQELADITIAFADMAVNDRNFVLSDIIGKIDPEDLQTIFDMQQDADLRSDFFSIDGIDMPWNEFDIDKFNTIKEMYGVEDVQQFINWTDEMERYRANAFLSEVLTSDQIADLWAYAQSGDVKVNRRSLHMMIRANYNATGKTGADLYNIVLQRIKSKKGL